jgi:hypothetical protein
MIAAVDAVLIDRRGGPEQVALFLEQMHRVSAPRHMDGRSRSEQSAADDSYARHAIRRAGVRRGGLEFMDKTVARLCGWAPDGSLQRMRAPNCQDVDRAASALIAKGSRLVT